MKLRTIFLIAVFASVLGANAQKLTVEKMAVAPMDLSASQYERKDLTGKPCALVKVQLATTGAQFEGNVIGKSDYKTGEYWVYMSEGSYMLSVKHPSFVPLDVNFREYGINGVKGKTTYKLTLLMPQGGGGNVDDGMRYLAMTVEPANATVYIDDNLQALQNGTLSMLLSMGQHQYRVEAPAYETKRGTFIIGEETLQLPVKLESLMASLGITATTAGTQIYVNDQLRGMSSWTGSLAAGTYRIEGRLNGHHSHRQTVTLSQRDNKQLTIPALQAITGNLNVNYQPLNAEVWLDGKKTGTSPNVFRNIQVGSHEVEIRANGHQLKKETVTIEEGKTAQLTGSLTKVPTEDSANGKTSGQIRDLGHDSRKGTGYSHIVFSDGTRFEGHFLNGIIDGTGIYYWSNSHYYVGHWSNGKRNGYGVEFFDNGTYELRYYENEKIVSRTISDAKSMDTGVGIYTGEMVNGRACGKGTFQWNNGLKFEGTWTPDGKSRYGVLFNSNSSNPHIVGQWTNEKMCGYCCIIPPKGNVQTGFWENGNYKYKSAFK